MELRKQRRLGEVLTDAFNIFFAYWRQLAVISIPVVVANTALSLVFLAMASGLPSTEELNRDSEAFTTDDALDLLAFVAVTLVIALPILFVLQQLVTGGAVSYLDEADKGNEANPSEALDKAQANLGTLVKATLRATVITFLFAVTIIGIPWAIYRIVRWLFLAQVIMLEGVRGQEVLARSAALVQGRWWNTLGRLIVVGLVISIPLGLLQQAIVAALPGVFGSILSSATGFISVPYGIIALTLIYFDLKARKAADDSVSIA